MKWLGGLLILLFSLSVVKGQNDPTIILREQYQYAWRVPANLNNCNKAHARCAGDMYLAENAVLTASGRRTGNMDSICTAMPTGDRAYCQWTFYFEHTNSEIQVSGVSYGHVENVTEVIVTGGTGDYLNVTGRGETYVVSEATERIFELYLYTPEFKPPCQYTEMFMQETGTINDVLVSATSSGNFGLGAKDLFSNVLAVTPNELGLTSGYDDGQCLYINRRWICQWNTRLPDENDKIFLQGSIASAADVAATVPIIGGTGKFINAKGSAVVTAKHDKNQGTYYWETQANFAYGCQMFAKTQRLSFRQYVANSSTIPSRAFKGKSPPNPGDVRVFVDELRTVAKRDEGATEERGNPAEGTATGTCTELNYDDKHYCEWIMQYPLKGVPNSAGASQILVVGTVSDNPREVSSVGIVGGSGLWTGAHGYGSFQAASSTIDDDDVGSVVGDFMLEFFFN